MSMIGYVYLVPSDELEDLLAHPKKIHGIIDRAMASEPDSPRLVELDKAWHGLHFLLTGTDWDIDSPLAFLAAGGAIVGEEDVGYGPARAFSAREVSGIASALSDLPVEGLRGRYDGPRMDQLEIYPSGHWAELNPSDAEWFRYFTETFTELKSALMRGKAEGLGLLVWLS